MLNEFFDLFGNSRLSFPRSRDSNFRWNYESRDNLVFSDTLEGGNDKM